MDHTPHDLEIERAVDEAITQGAFLPRWGWPTPRDYNGATGAERIRGWQKVTVARNLGLIARTAPCDVCGQPAGSMRHGEIYARPLAARPICRSCHFTLHRRFGDPVGWEQFLSAMPAADWVHSLLTQELLRAEMLEVAGQPDVFEALRRMKG